MLMQAFVVTALNPAGHVLRRVLPQFIDIERPLLPQMVALGACFVVPTLNSALYATSPRRCGASSTATAPARPSTAPPAAS
jgi:threonine/homoserine/homoserine lactone efflux protein